MDQWLNNGPALAYIKDLTLWVVVNNKCEPIMWTDDKAELAWSFASILEYDANERELNNKKKKPRTDRPPSHSAVNAPSSWSFTARLS